jgi:hypothetical protein
MFAHDVSFAPSFFLPQKRSRSATVDKIDGILLHKDRIAQAQARCKKQFPKDVAYTTQEEK